MFTTKRNNVLADGGMMQEGGTVDEVSGNEVPVGSTKEEVRDDIDAKLSVGEYVFPADVTRYYGIAKLEAMRREAQEGLKKMESGGRMGNAEQVSEEAVNEYDDAEFSKEVDEDMASYDEEQEYAEGGVVRKYENGGAVTYDPTTSREIYKRAPIKGFEMIPMSDDTGNVIYIPFINGKPQLNIPPGFNIKAATPKAEETAEDITDAATADTTKTTDETVGNKGGSDKGAELSQSQKDFFDNESAEDRDARLSDLGDSAMSLAKAAFPKLNLLTKVFDKLTDPYGFFAPTPLSDPANRLAVPSPKDLALAEQKALVDSFFAAPENQATIVNKVMDIAVTTNQDPNDVLGSMLSQYGQDRQAQDAADAADRADAQAFSAQMAQDAKDAADAKAARDAQDARDAAAAQAARDAQAAADAAAAQAARDAQAAADAAAAQAAADAAAAQAARDQAAREAQAAADQSAAESSRLASQNADAQARSDAAAAANNANYSNEGRNSRDGGGDSGGGGSTSGGSAAGSAARGGMGFGGTGSGVGGGD